MYRGRGNYGLGLKRNASQVYNINRILWSDTPFFVTVGSQWHNTIASLEQMEQQFPWTSKDYFPYSENKIFFGKGWDTCLAIHYLLVKLLSEGSIYHMQQTVFGQRRSGFRPPIFHSRHKQSRCPVLRWNLDEHHVVIICAAKNWRRI